jgi:hypothetical protein
MDPLTTAPFELLIVLEDGRELRHRVAIGELVIGRQPQAGLSLDDEYLSRKHCVLKLSQSQLSIQDLGSYNGSFVNGHKIHEGCLLAVGDVVKIGHCRLWIKDGNESTGSLKIYTPDLVPEKGVRPITQDKEAALSPEYQDIEVIKAKSAEVLRKRKKKRTSIMEIRHKQLSDSISDLPASVSGTLRYIPPALSEDENSENPTPIPDPNFTASAIMRTSSIRAASNHGAEDQERRGLRVIAQLARVLHSVEDMGDFYNFALGRILEVVPAERGLLMRLDRKRKGLYIEAVKSAIPSRDDLTARHMGISHTIAKRVLRDRVSVLVTDASLDDRFRDASSIQELQVRSILCTPIWYQDKVSGLIYLDHMMHSYAFTESDREFLVASANLVALTLHDHQD